MQPLPPTFTYKFHSTFQRCSTPRLKLLKYNDKLLDQHEELFIAITKLVTDQISMATIESSLEDFRDINKALPQKFEISAPG